MRSNWNKGASRGQAETIELVSEKLAALSFHFATALHRERKSFFLSLRYCCLFLPLSLARVAASSQRRSSSLRAKEETDGEKGKKERSKRI